MERDGRLLVLLCTWNDEPAAVKLSFDEGLLPDAPRSARLAETDADVALEEGELSVEMPAHGVRWVRIGSDEGQEKQ